MKTINEEKLREILFNCVVDYAQYLIRAIEDPTIKTRPVGVWFEQWWGKYVVQHTASRRKTKKSL